MTKILFICKQRPARYGASYGLLNSCRFLCNALDHMGVHAKLVEVVDNNGIDREVHRYKPTHVFIEALWVVPDKFDVLIPLHPEIQWYVRLHSNTPFIANEGMAMDWIVKYGELQKKYPQFHIAVNCTKMQCELKKSLDIDAVYTPNIYCPESIRDIDLMKEPLIENHHIISIASFGAIRPLKNQLIQAMAAMAFANELDKTLHFHMNHSRIENQGENVYKNLVALFNGSKHKLITHEWVHHSDFLHLIKRVDLGLQVSFSETFNIICADFVSMNIPIVGSKDIEWMNSYYQADPTNLNNIVLHMYLAWYGRAVNMQKLNTWGLEKYNHHSIHTWKQMLAIN